MEAYVAPFEPKVAALRDALPRIGRLRPAALVKHQYSSRNDQLEAGPTTGGCQVRPRSAKLAASPPPSGAPVTWPAAALTSSTALPIATPVWT